VAGRPEEAKQEMDLLEEVASQMDDKWKMGNNPASAVLGIARRMAAGELTFRQGQSADAFELLKQEVAREDQLAYDEPPGWMHTVVRSAWAL
jgi:hypothetical protein